jgi:hypothetical protein
MLTRAIGPLRFAASVFRRRLVVEETMPWDTGAFPFRASVRLRVLVG